MVRGHFLPGRLRVSLRMTLGVCPVGRQHRVSTRTGVWKPTNLDPENHWFVEDNHLSRSHLTPGPCEVSGSVSAFGRPFPWDPPCFCAPGVPFSAGAKSILGPPTRVVGLPGGLGGGQRIEEGSEVCQPMYLTGW